MADWLRLTPVVQTRPDGTLSTRGILPGRRNLVNKFARYIARRCNPAADLHLAFGHAICQDDAERLRDALSGLLPNIRRTTMTGLGSALGAHGGPGSIVVGVQEYVDPASLR
jgi:fatty acid-binding protein DegV